MQDSVKLCDKHREPPYAKWRTWVTQPPPVLVLGQSHPAELVFSYWCDDHKPTGDPTLQPI
jgi:hypothetical protein